MRKIIVAIFTSAVIGALLGTPAAVASLPDPSAPVKVAAVSRPDDGSGYVWQVFCKSGLSYSFIPASQFPLSPRFEEVQKPQTGDIAWWPEYVAIYVAQNASVISSAGYTRVAALGGEQPRYFRMKVAPGEGPGASAPSCDRSFL
ncbi:hypothetical protein FHS83_002241 [Rhizomicrobium palustre]|uniref:Uncharacterized protein n=1 Tax=Rhizomicrobium palustre TaxID=189966 RepID=A0A846N040_9PROT|nr:hypothetical protein [Rhizomicrobium palustre]NIK88923.1 hypothetical protein [Rhizomicrobium palustre]